jgi:hypothetical protein
MYWPSIVYAQKEGLYNAMKTSGHALNEGSAQDRKQPEGVET